MWNWLVGWSGCSWPILLSRSLVTLFRNQSSTESHQAGGVVLRSYTCTPGSPRLESRLSYELSQCNLVVFPCPTKQIPI